MWSGGRSGSTTQGDPPAYGRSSIGLPLIAEDGLELASSVVFAQFQQVLLRVQEVDQPLMYSARVADLAVWNLLNLADQFSTGLMQSIRCGFDILDSKR